MCRKLVTYAKELGVERIFTFAAMATRMHPDRESRVFAATTQAEGLDEIQQLNLELLEDGHIGGLNGVLLGAEELFAQARLDRPKAYELKSELDRFDVFRDYEDQFLDLFKSTES